MHLMVERYRSLLWSRVGVAALLFLSLMVAIGLITLDSARERADRQKRIRRTLGVAPMHVRNASTPYFTDVFQRVHDALAKTTPATLDEPVIAAVFEISVGTLVIYWIEATPSVDGVRIMHADDESVLDLPFDPAYLKEAAKTAELDVIYYAVVDAKAIQTPLRAGATAPDKKLHACLMRKGKPVSLSVPVLPNPQPGQGP